MSHSSEAEKGVISNLGYLPTSALSAHLLLKKFDLFPPHHCSFVRVSRLL